MVKCPHCQQSKRQNKAGRTRSGSQRYFCLVCSRTYTPQAKVQGHPARVREQAVRHSLEGISQRKTARLLQVSPQSVANWLALAAAKLQEQPEPVVPPEIKEHEIKGHADEVMEQDELYTFLGAKREKKGATSATPRASST